MRTDRVGKLVQGLRLDPLTECIDMAVRRCERLSGSCLVAQGLTCHQPPAMARSILASDSALYPVAFEMPCTIPTRIQSFPRRCSHRISAKLATWPIGPSPVVSYRRHLTAHLTSNGTDQEQVRILARGKDSHTSSKKATSAHQSHRMLSKVDLDRLKAVGAEVKRLPEFRVCISTTHGPGYAFKYHSLALELFNIDVYWGGEDACSKAFC